MKKALSFWIPLVVALVALVASSILLVEYVKPQPVFCNPDGGCGMLKRTPIAYPFGVPMPVFGIAGLLGIATVSLLSGRVARIVQVVLTSLGALVAAGLIYVQVKLSTFCPYCIVVDTSVLVLFVLAIARAVRSKKDETNDLAPSRRSVAFSSVALVLAIVLPVAFGMVKKPIPVDVPAFIADEIRKTPRGQVTLVDFVDFECPYCRMTHTELSPLLDAEKNRLRIVRVHVPLSIHPHAKDAARAAICGERAGKADEMANALFEAEPETLTPDGTVSLAQTLGLDPVTFRACLTSPETDARLESDKQRWRESHGQGLPTIWMGTNKLEGAQDQATLRATFDTAAHEL